MKKNFLTILFISCFFALMAQEKPSVLITSLYRHGAAGSPNSTYSQSFCELYNYGEDSVDLTGYYIVYHASGNLGANSNVAMINYGSGAQRLFLHDSLHVKIAPKSYFLVGGAKVANHPTAASLPVEPDATPSGWFTPTTGGIFAIIKNIDNNQDGVFDTIFSRDWETSAIQENVVDYIVYGKIMKWGGAPLTGTSSVVPDSVKFNNCFPEVFDTIISPAASVSYVSVFVRKMNGCDYQNTGALANDFEKIAAAGYDIHNSESISCASDKKDNMVDADKISLYPNPTSNGTFTVNSGNITKGNVFIYNVTGKLVAAIKINSNSTRCDISGAGQGLYFVTVVNAQGIIQSVKKLVF